MATVVGLLKRLSSIADERLQHMQDAELTRDKEYRSAVWIQSWFRGIRIRAYLRYLNENAVLIQRHWRGYSTRCQVRQLLKDDVYQINFQHYTSMAVKIQRLWRGYRSRKCLFNFTQRKKYFEELRQKNDIVRNELTNHGSKQAELKKWKQEDERERKMEDFAQRNHHLLSTVVMPGVYNSPFQLVPNELEFRLRSATLIKTENKIGNQSADGNVFDPTCTQYSTQIHSPLPPVRPKPMGPFRDPHEVQKQRYKPFQPSLRVITDYFALDETRKHLKSEVRFRRLNNVDFHTCSRLRSKSYDPLMDTSTKYGQIPYGTQYFREEIRNVWLSKNFRTVVPPIPVFDRFNDTYSQGTV